MQEHRTREDRAESHARAFRSLVWRVRPRRLQHGVERLLAMVSALASGDVPLDVDESFSRVYRRARAQTVQQLCRAQQASPSVNSADVSNSAGRAARTRVLLDAHLPETPMLAGPDFHCDAGLGGLARLLRAAGYDVAFWPGIDDDDLIQKVLAGSAILLTNDRPLTQRGVVQRGIMPALLVPISMKKSEQFAYVIGKLDLPLRTPRCMACGGRLLAVPKDSVRDRIPPRTYPWCDDYFVCQRCDKLFWKGTHWQRIRQYLADVRQHVVR